MRVLLKTIIVVAAIVGCLGGPRPFQTQSGLQIIILGQGKGPKVVPGDEVEIHKIISLINGEVVFSTYEQGEPLRFCQGNGIVIDGLDEAVLGMKVGEKRAVIVPPHLSRRGYDLEQLSPEDRNYLRAGTESGFIKRRSSGLRICSTIKLNLFGFWADLVTEAQRRSKPKAGFKSVSFVRVRGERLPPEPKWKFTRSLA